MLGKRYMINLMNGIRVNELLKLNEYDLNKLQEYCEILSWFMVSSNDNYLYNESYVKEYFEELKIFLVNIKIRKIYIDIFVGLLTTKFLNKRIIIEFDEYIIFDNMNIDENKYQYKNKIPQNLLKDKNYYIYINCKIQDQFGLYNTYVMKCPIMYFYENTQKNELKTIKQIEEDINSLIKNKEDKK